MTNYTPPPSITLPTPPMQYNSSWAYSLLDALMRNFNRYSPLNTSQPYVLLLTPDGTKTYKISVNNSGVLQSVLEDGNTRP